ncbi:MAG: glutaredoxin family protein [Methanocalculus sp. MSAO_Arc1]|uniref:glutaredoxin family protein n=1 Tax=Methanocalculus TaxID=71151 RepID=UPI000FF48F5F|nr:MULTISPECIES: glutaredoxin family protein [unclassified Methanocalculus]MCP1661367.1 glutaredoxin [Methanocalculus sp. AMF5]RQD79659.1 MAG: glutaredoxin family protein [Methanocalculus sp. MSAO_Arc1]
MEYTVVDGEDRGDLVLYALSTCRWCNLTKELLQSLNVKFRYIYADLLQPDELDQILIEVERFNPAGSFPTLVINGKDVIIGYKEKEIRKVLG